MTKVIVTFLKGPVSGTELIVIYIYFFFSGGGRLLTSNEVRSHFCLAGNE